MATQAEPTTDTKRVVKLTLYFNKKADISEEEFHRYWSENHSAIICGTKLFKEKILKYNQYHNDMALRSRAASFGLPTMEFDGVAEVWVADMQTLLDGMKDPEYLEIIAPDEANFIAPGSQKFMFGYDDLKMDNIPK